MKKVSVFLFALVLGLVVGCTSTDSYASNSSHQLSGEASWYGSQFHGKLTASGETYDMRALTAAHRTLAFGTIVRVTNTQTNKSVEVKINDRGPYADDRVIDLSQKAFELIGDTNKGVMSVKIEIIDDSNTFRYKH